MRLPGYLQLGAHDRAQPPMHGFGRHRQLIFRPQPWPDSLVARTTLRLGEALTEGWLPGLGDEWGFAWGLGNGQHLADAPAGVCSQPAPDGIAVDPKPLRHLAAGAGLLDLSEIEGLHALVCLGLACGSEQRVQRCWRVVDRRNGLFHGVQPSPRMTC
jgi:hypothetical protein